MPRIFARYLSKMLFLILVSSQTIGQQNANPGSTLTLRQCVDTALRNNLVVEQSQLTKEAGKVSLDQSKANLLPFIGATASQNLSYGRSLNPYTYTYVNQQISTGNYAINSSLTLFSGLQLLNAIKQNQYAYGATKMDLQQQKDNITLSVLLAYLQVLSSQDLLAISKEQADVDSRQVDRLTIQNDEGALLLLSNLYDLKGQYQGDLANIAVANNTLETAKINLFQLMNIPYNRDVQLEKVTFEMISTYASDNPDSIYQVALGVVPLIKSAELKTKAFQKALQSVRGQYYPTLSVYGSINTNYSNAATVDIPTNVVEVPTTDYVVVGGNNYNVITKQQNFYTQNLSFSDQFKNNKFTSFGLQLNIPILNSLRARNNVRMAKINLRNAEYVNTNAKLQLQQNVEQAFQNMITAYKQYKSFTEQVVAYQESFRTTEIRFNEGVINSDTYLISKNNIDRANINLIMARYAYLFRTKILDYYLGRLQI